MTGAFGEAMRDPEDAKRRVDDWAAGFAQKAERYKAAQERTEELRLTASSSDGTVRVTVGADGVVSDLAFGAKTRSIPPEELARMVLTTMRQAQSRITGQVAEVMQEQLGEEDQETRSLLLNSLRSRFPDEDDPDDGPPEPADPTPPPPPAPSTPPAPSAGRAATPPAGGPPPGQPPTGGATPPRRPGRADPVEDDNTPW
ncbi:YbaB/EbfC family nucleoid-associated protein [Prauserella cavernicola]|uniref:YbaB/EbfC family nucleoid-associated protein n=1 Tax=Prauserella cavernicola TaxID=2800127 RepID=A0A934QZH0_9PSEU|nr:YbaB/EbfC family nucleoid-associated protein [Prauserella cavernicola]MBK1789421.1 YbaB/EbfC family nucleoid-associated protein [Prauserella cavernicola]